jgi:hypothetical protein
MEDGHRREPILIGERHSHVWGRDRDMTTLTVLAALAAAPLLFGVFLAVALGGYMLVRFVPDLVSGLRASSAPRL